MALSPSNPFAPKEKPSSSGTSSNSVNTQKTFSSSNPFSSGTSQTPTKEFAPSSPQSFGGGGSGSWGPEMKPTANKPKSQSKIPVSGKKETYVQSLQRQFPKFIEGFLAPFKGAPLLGKKALEVADLTYKTGQAGIGLAGATLGTGLNIAFDKNDNLYKEYRREGYSPWQAFIKTGNDLREIQKQVVKNVYLNPEENIRPLAEASVRRAVKKDATIIDKVIGYGGAGALKYSELLGNVFNLPIAESLFSARVQKTGTPSYIKTEALAEQGLNPAKTFAKTNVARVQNPYVKNEYLRFTRLKDGTVKVDNFRVEASPAERLLGKFWKPKNQRDIIEGEIVTKPAPTSRQIPAQTAAPATNRPVYATQEGNIEHGMDMSMLDDALKSGLKPGTDGRVFMAETRNGINQAVSYERLARNPNGIRLVMDDAVQDLQSLDVNKLVSTGDVAVSEAVKPNLIKAIVVRSDLYDDALKIVQSSGKNIPIFVESMPAQAPAVIPQVQEVVKQVNTVLRSIKPSEIPMTPNRLMQAPFATNLINRTAEALDEAVDGLGAQLKDLLDEENISSVAQIESGVTRVLQENGLVDPTPVAFEGFPAPVAEEAGETALSTAGPATQEVATSPTSPVVERTTPEAISTARTGEITPEPASGQAQLPLDGVEALPRTKQLTGDTSGTITTRNGIETLKPPDLRAPLVTRREDVLLRQRIRAEVRGSKAGFKAGEKITRQALTEKFRQQTETMQQIRADLAEFIQQELPPASRGKFLDAIKSDLTLRQQFKMVERVEKEKNRLLRNEIVPRLKKMSELTSDSIALKYKKSLNELLGKLDFKKPSNKTKRSLAGLKGVLDADPEFAKLHPDLVKRVERLTRQPVADLTTVELKELEDVATMLVERGKVMRALEVVQNERMEKIAREKFASSTVKVSEDKPIKDMSQVERMKYESKRATFNTLHTMRWARIFDGYKTNGENLKAIKDLSATENYINDQANIVKQDMLERINKVTPASDVTEDMQVRIVIRSLIDQGKVSEAQKLLEAHPVEGVTDVSEIKLTETEQQLLDIGRQIIKDHLENKVVATYEALENQIFPKVENYTPIFYEGEQNLLSSEVVERQKFTRRNLDAGFTQERQENVDKIPRHDFFGMIADHIDSALWYTELQPKLKILARITQSEEYLNAGGTLAVEQWRKLIDVIARQGFSANYQANWWLKKFRLNLSQAMLGFRVTSIAAQPFAVFDAIAAAQTNWGPKATAEVMKEFMQSWLRPGYSGKIIAESPALKQRQGGELAITESLELMNEAKTWYQKTYAKFIRASFKLLQKGDVKTASGVQKGIQNILEKNGVKDAKQEAEFFMNMVSASSNVTLRPTVLATGDLARLWFTFQTFVMNRWGVIWEDVIKDGVVHGDWKKKMNALTGLTVLLGGMVAEEYARREIKKLMGKSETNQQSLAEVALTAIPRNIPYFGSLFDIFSPYDPSVSPAVITTVQRIGKGVQSAVTGKKPETRLKGISTAVENFINLLFGVPGGGQAFDLINNAAFPANESGEDTPSKNNPFIIP